MITRKIWAIWTLWLVVASSCLECSSGLRHIRGLQQSPACPVDNCDASIATSCAWSRGAWTCSQCAPGYVRIDDGQACVCQAGTYLTAGGTCMPCPLNYYCPRGENPIACPNGLVTQTPGARRLWNCVNPPGHYLAVTALGTPQAVPCGPDTYSNGYNRLRECTPCPSGSRTDPGQVQGTQTSSSACKAPPGYLMVTGAAVPCAKGSFTTSYSGTESWNACRSCQSVRGPGLTTEGIAANQVEDCYFLEPGYAPVDFRGQVRMTVPVTNRLDIVSARPCPQNYYCPGGDPTDSQQLVVACSNGKRTAGDGAIEESQCVCAPGWFWDGSNCSECPSGTFKEGWNLATTCTACRGGDYSLSVGLDGWKSDKNMLLPQLDPQNGRVMFRLAVRGNSTACYMEPGSGSIVYYDGGVPATRVRVFKCPSGFYSGVLNRTFGVKSIPCQECPTGQTTSCAGLSAPAQAACVAQLGAVADAVGDGSYIGARTSAGCVHLPGHGWSTVSWDSGVYGTQAATFSVPCPIGYANPGGNNGTCTPCPAGTNTTTAGQPYCT